MGVREKFSMEDCAKECTRLSNCGAFDYPEGSGSCRLAGYRNTPRTDGGADKRQYCERKESTCACVRACGVCVCVCARAQANIGAGVTESKQTLSQIPQHHSTTLVHSPNHSMVQFQMICYSVQPPALGA